MHLDDDTSRARRARTIAIAAVITAWGACAVLLTIWAVRLACG